MIRRGTENALGAGESFVAGCRVEPHMLGRNVAAAMATGQGRQNLSNAGLAERMPTNSKLGLVATDRRVLVFDRKPLGGFRLRSEFSSSEVKDASYFKEKLGRGTLMVELADESVAMVTATEADDAEGFVSAVRELARRS